MPELPTGTVTFLFTDIEGSTRLLQQLGDRYAELRDEHAAIIRRAIAEGGGVEVSTVGDSFFAVFRNPVRPMAGRSSFPTPPGDWWSTSFRKGPPSGTSGSIG